MSSKTLVSIIAPVYNEQDALREFLERIVATVDKLSQRYRFEIIWVDDGSTDQSLATAKRLTQAEPRLRVVELRRNFGQTAALQAGLDLAEGEIAITMDADLQHFPEEIPQFIEKIEAGYDLVCGWRKNRKEGLKRRFPSKVANFMLRKISQLSINDIGTTYRAYRREVIQDVRLLGESHRFVPIFASVAGARVVEIPIENIERPAGESSYGLERVFNVAIDMVFLYFFVRYMDRPIRIFGKVAILCTLTGLGISAVLLATWLQTGIAVVREYSGWFMLAVLLMLAALQILATGLVAEILVRVYFPTSNQAPYKIRKVWSQAPEAAPGDAAGGEAAS